jgi:hypothetical protein
MSGRKAFRVGIVALAAVQVGIWLVAGSIAWSFRDLMVGSGSPQAASNASFAIVIFGVAAINAIALVPFLARSHGWGWFVLTAVQLGDIALCLAWASPDSVWWWLIIGVAGFTIAALLAFRYFEDQPQVE